MGEGLVASHACAHACFGKREDGWLKRGSCASTVDTPSHRSHEDCRPPLSVFTKHNAGHNLVARSCPRPRSPTKTHTITSHRPANVHVAAHATIKRSPATPSPAVRRLPRCEEFLQPPARANAAEDARERAFAPGRCDFLGRPFAYAGQLTNRLAGMLDHSGYVNNEVCLRT